MANKEQVALLRQGAEVWNQWREKNPDAEIDLCSADLRDADLSGADLNNAPLVDASFSYADLEGADLEGANLEGAELPGAKLNDANLKGTNFQGANLIMADLCGADLEGAFLNDTNLMSTDFSGANLADAELLDADLYNANLIMANFCGADLRGALLTDACFRNTNFSDANLIDANLFRANLSGANLSGANFSGANLMATDFSGANLFKANLRCSQVLNAYFKRATLTGACIGDWQIGSNTNLEDVKCDYIFRTYDGRMKFTGRLPVDPGSTFAPGEFEQWIQVRKGALDTIDITFSQGIYWQVFFTSLDTVRRQHPETELRMQAVQEVNGIYVASLKLETEIDGEALRALEGSIEKDVKACYEKQLGEAHDRIKVLDGRIEGLQWSLEQTLKMGSNQINQTFQAPVGNVAGTNQGTMQNTQHNYADEEK